MPDTFHVLAEFPRKHSLLLSSTMANSRHIPGLIRGWLGVIIMVDDGMFKDAHDDPITLSPEGRAIDDAYRAKFGDKDAATPVKDTLDKMDALHMANFLDCVRSRQKPTLDVETSYHVQVTISMSLQAYRVGRVLYRDARNQEGVPAPPEA